MTRTLAAALTALVAAAAMPAGANEGITFDGHVTYTQPVTYTAGVTYLVPVTYASTVPQPLAVHLEGIVVTQHGSYLASEYVALKAERFARRQEAARLARRNGTQPHRVTVGTRLQPRPWQGVVRSVVAALH